jgi:hypothetical protein
MKAKKRKNRNRFNFSKQRLFQLELRIARRADELMQRAFVLPARSLECWLRAEHEVLAEILPLASFRGSPRKIGQFGAHSKIPL